MITGPEAWDAAVCLQIVLVLPYGQLHACFLHVDMGDSNRPKLAQNNQEVRVEAAVANPLLGSSHRVGS